MEASTTEAIREKLQEVFDYDHFREEQEAIIKNILDGKNTFVLMPTGGGKSLCYQIPALMKPGVTIVISPLIALMKNQVDQLLSRGVHAAFLNSTLSRKAIEEIKSGVLSGKTKLLYVAPESLIKAENLAFLKQASIAFIAVDEAHCISDWGHDFRPEYRKIKTVLDQELGALPMIALTATATPKVQQDILKNLEIEDATLFQSSFNRENLYYEIRHKDDVEKQLIKFIKEQSKASGIVYCQSRKKVEELANLLHLNGIQAAPYHAGLEAKVREQNQDAFLSKEVDVIVATIAFGMGIDKSDVRFVIHHDVPRSLEGYYQETGRAGRDGQSGTCLMFYSDEDLKRLERFNSSKSGTEREKAQSLLKALTAYIVSGVCRRKQLLHYFGETYGANCDNCDNCNNPTTTYSGEDSIKLSLTAVQQVQERFGIDHVIRFLRGIEDDYIKSYRHQALSSFGQGSRQDEAFWRSVIRQALLLELLSKDITQGSTLSLTAKGKQFLKESYPITLYEDKIYASESEQASLSTSSQEGGCDQELLDLLEKVRTSVAKEKGVPTYAVLQDASLEEMALVYPTSLDALIQVSGLSMNKAKKFGAPFVELIRQYVADHDIVPVSDIVVKSAASRSKNKVYIIQQVDRKIDLEEIAKSKTLTMDELLKEMEQLCYAGTKLNIDYYINTILTKEQQKEVYGYFMQAQTDNIKVAMNALEDAYDEEELRLMRIKFLSEVAN
ncbi:MAG: DNA helicase RecQ [Bacteroidota bacterium]